LAWWEGEWCGAEETRVGYSDYDYSQPNTFSRLKRVRGDMLSPLSLSLSDFSPDLLQTWVEIECLHIRSLIRISVFLQSSMVFTF
jgi:hypothetical protein